MTAEEFNALRREIQSLQKRADQATWQIEQIQSRLYREFKCKGEQEALALIAKLQKKDEVSEAELQEMLARFKEKYRDHI